MWYEEEEQPKYKWDDMFHNLLYKMKRNAPMHDLKDYLVQHYAMLCDDAAHIANWFESRLKKEKDLLEKKRNKALAKLSDEDKRILGLS